MSCDNQLLAEARRQVAGLLQVTRGSGADGVAEAVILLALRDYMLGDDDRRADADAFFRSDWYERLAAGLGWPTGAPAAVQNEVRL